MSGAPHDHHSTRPPGLDHSGRYFRLPDDGAHMSATRFTPAQLRALDWLPADGSWRTHAPHTIASALDSLGLYHRELIEQQRGPFGARGGHCRRDRLTPAGIAAKAQAARRKTGTGEGAMT